MANREEEIYEPAEHRHVKQPTNYCETMTNMLKASIGTGILAMPHAFSKAGYVIGIIGTALIGLVCTYCMRKLVKAQYECCRRYKFPSMTYTETAHYATLEGPISGFPFMAILGNTFVILFQIGAACIYMIFVSKNVQHVLEGTIDIEISVRMYIAIFLIPMALTLLLNSLKFLAVATSLANVATLVGFAIITYYLFKDGIYPENMIAFGKYTDYPLFAGTVVFAMESIGIIIPLENDMKKPLLFTSTFGVLNVSMIPTVVLYSSVGLFGYMRFGDDCAGSITLNLPEKEILAEVARLLLTFAIFITYILGIFVAYDIIWKAYIQPRGQFDSSKWSTFFYQYCLRLIIMMLTFILALIIPNIELFISLVGALCLASAGIAFPGMFDMFIWWHKLEGVAKCFNRTMNVLIIILGIIILIIGVSMSVYDIYVEIYK